MRRISVFWWAHYRRSGEFRWLKCILKTKKFVHRNFGQNWVDYLQNDDRWGYMLKMFWHMIIFQHLSLIYRPLKFRTNACPIFELSDICSFKVQGYYLRSPTSCSYSNVVLLICARTSILLILIFFILIFWHVYIDHIKIIYWYYKRIHFLLMRNNLAMNLIIIGIIALLHAH